MPDHTTHEQDFTLVAGLLACPDCGGQVTRQADAMACAACHATFPVTGGIPVFARFGTVEEPSGAPPVQTSEKYQQNYQDVTEAARYNRMYTSRFSKRWSTNREFTLLERLLSSQPRCQTLLDLPSGGGRLSPQIARYTDLLIESDIALGQVQYGRQHGRVPDVRQFWMTASGFHIPLRTGSVDGVVCVRLSHHLPTAAERERLLRELLRVSRRFVIMTFFDHHSLKNLGRRLRRPLDRKPPKMTMTVARVRELAAEGAADLVACPALSHIGSGHRYALLVKRPA
jgi:SAM-dependent methyltransferase